MDDFELVALGASDLLTGLPTRSLGPSLAISYEGLATQPAATLGRLCAFLGVPCPPSYVAAVSAFVRTPHVNTQYIAWGGAVTQANITAFILRLPPALGLAAYLTTDLRRFH
eukprot:5220176-Prymnesium_polylepis.1